MEDKAGSFSKAGVAYKQYYGTKAGIGFTQTFELPGKKGLASAKVKPFECRVGFESFIAKTEPS